MEKNLKNIHTFEQHIDKNLNISDVSDSYLTLEEVKILMIQSYIIGRDNHKVENDLNDMKTLMKDFKDSVIDKLIKNKLDKR